MTPQQLYQHVLETQMGASETIVAMMRSSGITADREKKAEFYFSDSPYRSPDPQGRAKKLIEEMNRLHYSAEYRHKQSNDVYSIYGTTPKMKMEEKVLYKWTKEMCELGFRFNYLFEGWGPDNIFG